MKKEMMAYIRFGQVGTGTWTDMFPERAPIVGENTTPELNLLWVHAGSQPSQRMARGLA